MSLFGIFSPKSSQLGPEQVRGAIEDAQMQVASRSPTASPAYGAELVDFQEAQREVAILHRRLHRRHLSEQSAWSRAMENSQMVRSESDEQFEPLRRMAAVFDRVGVPGISVEVIDAIQEGAPSKSSFTLPEYVGRNPIGDDWSRYHIVDVRKGWLIPAFTIYGDEKPFVEAINTDMELALEFQAFNGDYFSSFYNMQMLITPNDNWTKMLTPAGVVDGLKKGVLLADTNQFQRGYSEQIQNDSLVKSLWTDSVYYRVRWMEAEAQKHGWRQPENDGYLATDRAYSQPPKNLT